MSQIGGWDAVIDTKDVDVGAVKKSGPSLKGLVAFIGWRSVYLTKQVGWVNKALIPMYWCKSMLFGRDVSRF